MNFGQRLAALRNRKHLTQDQVAEAIGVKRGRYNAWEHGISNPDHEKLVALAQFHHVTVDFLLGRPHPDGVNLLTPDMYADGYTDQSVFEDLEKDLPKHLSPKEERDIAADLERMLDSLASKEAIAFQGEPMDEESKELLRNSLESSMRLAKLLAKQKFNPNKNK